MLFINSDLLEDLFGDFGKYIGDNFDNIWFYLTVIVIIAWHILRRILSTLNNQSEKTNGWISDAHNRQQRRYKYTDYVNTNQYAYNEKSRIWVDAEQLEKERHKAAYEENRRKWQAYEQKIAEKEAEERRIQEIINETHKPVYLTEEEKELAKRIRIDRANPSFEEWKAAREKEKQNEQHPEK